ncbi:MAG: fluoride efflux transporter CrcB [Paracoccaceae bacterium]
MSWTLTQVAIGGALGASCRYMVGHYAVRMMGHGFPWGTLTVNIVGSFLMGVLITVLAEKGGARLSPLLVTGVLGGFTTFSSFSLDAVTLFERGQAGLAGAYVFVSVMVSLAAIAVGITLTRALFA